MTGPAGLLRLAAESYIRFGMNVPTSKPTPKPATGSLIREEIHRFIVAARERGEFDLDRRRRAHRRCHRSWPLLVSSTDPRYGTDMCVALYNASPLGIAFLCPHEIPPGTLVLIRLFWCEVNCPFVPAVVKHCTANEHGHLIGCAFDLGNGQGNK